MSIVVVTPPGEDPVTLQETKNHLRVTLDDDDARISNLIRSATAQVEEYTGRALVERQVKLILDSFPAGDIELPMPPLKSVQAVKYWDEDGVQQTLDAAIYQVDTASLIGRIVLAEGQAWPATAQRIDAVTVEFTAGYGAAADVDERAVSAILLDVQANYDLDGRDMETLRASIDNLLAPLRVHWA